jgi:hypothetical protein
MSKSKFIAYVAVLVFLAALTLGSTASAETVLQGKFTPEQIKGGCSKVNGDFMPQGQSGTYGCENRNNGNMILCRGDNQCTFYQGTGSTKQMRRIIRGVGLACEVELH